MKPEVQIRLLQTLDEFRACQAVQRTTWTMPDLLIIPYTQLVTMHQNGGCVLGAFDDSRLVGYVSGFLGRQDGEPPYLYSQRMGVLPDCQGRGIGKQLKWAQREWALAQKIERIVWTFDPLEPANARLNLAKLGGIARRFKRDIYGEHGSTLHAGLPTDRLVIDWELGSPRVLDRLAGHKWPEVDVAALAAQGVPVEPAWWDDRDLPHPAEMDIARGTGSAAHAACLLLQVPAAWQAIRHSDPALAAEWRAYIRLALEHHLDAGYAVTGYTAQTNAGPMSNFYVLEKGV